MTSHAPFPSRRPLSRRAAPIAPSAASLLGVALLVLCAPAAVAAITPAEQEGALQRETQALVDELVPRVAALYGFARPLPVRVEATTRSKLGALVLPSLREVYGEDGLRRSARMAAALGLLPDGYDLEAGMVEMVLAVMGGGYDPARDVFYVLADLPPELQDATQRRMVAAHEVTHALEDQASEMLVHQRRGATDWDYEFLYNSIAEGAAYLTMMAVVGETSLDQAADPTELLLGTQRQLETAPGFEPFARAPRYLKDQLFAHAVTGIAFLRQWVRLHPGQGPATLFAQLPASSEQVLHYQKYVENDRPATLDLTVLDGSLPREWRPYGQVTVGERQVAALLAEHPAVRDLASSIAAGWDGFVIRAFEDQTGGLVLLGLSAWDSADDAAEFRSAFEQVLASRHPAGSFAMEQSGSLVRIVIGVPDQELRRLALSAMSTAATLP